LRSRLKRSDAVYMVLQELHFELDDSIDAADGASECEPEAAGTEPPLKLVPSPRHKYPDRNADLTENSIRFGELVC
jgi:hypothetical protein